MRAKAREETTDELRPEYDLARLLSKGVTGKYVQRYRRGTNLVLLEPDVAKAFPTEGSVNAALRLVIKLTKLSGSRKRLADRA